MVEGGVCPCWNADNVTENLFGRLIYKDECSRTFATPKSPGGLDICLKTFVGSHNPPGVDASENPSKIHYKNTGNPLVMNIKKTKKVSGAPTQVTKLAIGKPGGIDPETDNYDTAVTVWCHKCQKHLDHFNPKI